MPRLLDTRSRTDELADALVRLLGERGLDAPSSRRIAVATGISAATLLHHYESRERLLSVLAHTICRRTLAGAGGRLRRDGVAALLPAPADPVGLGETRAYLAVIELGRGGGLLAEVVAHYEEEERHLLRHAARGLSGGDEPTEGDLDLYGAVLVGLRHAVCRRVDPMAPEAARAVLERCLGDYPGRAAD